jgi:hypothetical protein
VDNRKSSATKAHKSGDLQEFFGSARRVYPIDNGIMET